MKNIDIKDNQLIIEINEILKRVQQNNALCCIELDGMQMNESFITIDLVIQMFSFFMRPNNRNTLSWRNVIKNVWMAFALEESILFESTQMGFQNIIMDGNVITDETLYALLRRNSDTLRELKLMNINGGDGCSLQASSIDVIVQNSKAKESSNQQSELEQGNGSPTGQNGGTGDEQSSDSHNIYGNMSDERRKRKKNFTDVSAIFGQTCSLVLQDEELKLKSLVSIDFSGSVQQNCITFLCAILVKSSNIRELYLRGSETGKYSIMRQSDLEYLTELLYEMRIVSRNQLEIVDISFNTEIEQNQSSNFSNADNNNNVLAQFIEALLKTQEQSIQKIILKGRNDEGKNMINDNNISALAKAFSKKKVKSLRELDISQNALQKQKSFEELNVLLQNVFESAPSLRHLKMVGKERESMVNDVVADGISRILDQGRAQELHSLDFSQNLAISTSCFKKLVLSLITNCSKLDYLNLAGSNSHVMLTNEKAEAVVSILEDNVDYIQKIREIDISRNVALSARVLGQLMRSIFMNCNHLEILRVRGYLNFSMIENEKAKALALALPYLANKNNVSSNLTTINFSQMLLSSANRKTFLLNNQLSTGSTTYFRVLDISFNDIDAGPLNTLFKGLLENKSLKLRQINQSRTADIQRHHSTFLQKQLDQEKYPFATDSNIQQSISSFRDIISIHGGKIFPSLQEVVITEIALINPNVLENFTKAIFSGSFKSLKKLGLVGSPKMQVLDDERVEMLSKIFDEYHQNLQLLEEVDISQNSINASPLHLLLESIFQCPSVTRLKICGSEDYTMINNVRAKSLTEFFDCQRNLQYVDLSYNRIDDQQILQQLLENIVYNNNETLHSLDLFYLNPTIAQLYIETLTSVLSKFNFHDVQIQLQKGLSNPLPSQSPKSKRRSQYNHLFIKPPQSNIGQFLDSPNAGNNISPLIMDISPSAAANNYNPRHVSPTNKKQLSKFKIQSEVNQDAKLMKRGSVETEKINSFGLQRQNNTLHKQNSLNLSPIVASGSLNDKKSFQLNLLKINQENSSNSNSDAQKSSLDAVKQSNISQQQTGLKQFIPNRKESDEVNVVIKKQESSPDQQEKQFILTTQPTKQDSNNLPPLPDLQKQPSSNITNFFSNFLNLNPSSKVQSEPESTFNKLSVFAEISLFFQGCRSDKIEMFRRTIKKSSKVQVNINTNYKLSCILPSTRESEQKSKHIQSQMTNTNNNTDPSTLQTLSDTFYLDKVTISQLDLSSCIEKIYWLMQNKKTLIVKREALEEMPLLAYCFSFNKNFKSFKLDTLFANSGLTTLFVNELFLKTCRSVLPIKPDSAYLHSIILNANFFKILEFMPNELEHIIFPSSNLNPGFECIKDDTFILSIQSYCQHITSLKTIQLEYEFNQEDHSYYYLNELELIQKLLIMPPTILKTKPKSNLNFLKALYSILYDSYYFVSCEIDYNETSALNSGIAVSLIEKVYQMNPSQKVSRFTFFIKKFFYYLLDLIINKESIYQLDQQIIQLNEDVMTKKIYGIGFKELLIMLNIFQIFAQITPAMFSDLDDPQGKISPIAYFIFAGFGAVSFFLELILYLDLLRYVSHLIPGLYVQKAKGIIPRVSNWIKKKLMNIKMFNYKILKCGIQLFQSVIARYDTFSDVSFIVACFQKKYFLYAYISMGILVFNLLLNQIYFLIYLFRKRKVKRVLNTDNIIQYYKIAALTECRALSEVLDQICPYNVKHLPDWCIFRGWRNQSINSHILNYMQKFLLKNLPQIVLQTLYLLKNQGSALNNTVIISMVTSIVSFCISFLTFLTIRPSAITQIDFNELAAKKQIELVQKYKVQEFEANKQFKKLFPIYYASTFTHPHIFQHSLNTAQNYNNNYSVKNTENRNSIMNGIGGSKKNSIKNITNKKLITQPTKMMNKKKTNLQIQITTPTNNNNNNNSTFQNLRIQKNSVFLELSRINNKSIMQQQDL